MANVSCSTLLRRAIAVFFEYDTPKIVHIQSKKVGVINRLIQLVIIGYIVGFVIVYKKGYQETERVSSGVTAKLKGVLYTNLSDTPGVGSRIWDVGDTVIPSQENDAFFVMTNVIVTPNQTQSTCDEDPALAPCTSDSDCTAGQPVINGNGIMTGKCIPSQRPGVNATVCEIRAWCPVEINKRPPHAILNGTKDFTVLIKNNIEFRKFSVKRRNILPDVTNQTYLRTCNWGRERDRYCPVFRLGDVLYEAGHDFDVMAVEGGVIAFEITWDCDLDHGEDKCNPEYSFRRLDKPDALIANGWNFRTAYHYVDGGVERRTLVKAYGIRFIILVQGTARKFSVVPLILNLASGLAMLAIATTLCDIVVLYLLQQRKLFNDKKYLVVKGDDAWESSHEGGSLNSIQTIDLDSEGTRGTPEARRRNRDDADQLSEGD